MMKRLLVHTRDRDRTQSKVWDVSKPLPLGFPVKWVLVNGENGVRVLDLRGENEKIENGRVTFFTHEEIREGGVERMLDGTNSDFAITVRESSALRAAHSSHSLRTRLKESVAQVWVYSGVRTANGASAVGASSPVSGAYIGYYGLSPLFVAYPEEGSLRIKALAEGLVIKQSGQPATDIPVNTSSEFPLGPGSYVTLRKHRHWWKFQLVSVPVRAAERIATRPELTEEDLKWKRSLLALFLLLLLCLLGIEFFVSEPPTPIPLPAPQEVKVVIHHPRGEHGERASGGQSAAPSVQKVADQPAPPAPPQEKAQEKANADTKIDSKATAKVGASTVREAAPRPKLSESQAAHNEALRKANLLRKALLGSKIMAVSPAAGSGTINPDSRNEIASQLSKSNQATSQNAGAAPIVDVKPMGKVEGIDSKGALGKKSGLGYSAQDSVDAWMRDTKKSLTNISGTDSSVEEGLTRNEVAAVIRAHISEVRYCHEAALVRDPKIAGRVVLHFVIAGTGAVKTVNEESTTLKDHDLGDCISRRLVNWKFPLPRGGVNVNVSFPFVFKVLDSE
jgi:hypothetical protein